MALSRRWAERPWVGGQVGITAAVAKVEQVLQCFQDRGALAARFYSETQTDGQLPKIGAVLVINQSRINQEMINCALGGQEDSHASAQAIDIEPCASAGTLEYQGDRISYVYVGYAFRCLRALPTSLRQSDQRIGN